MIALPIPPQLVPLFAALLLIAFAAFVVAIAGFQCYRWKCERQEAERLYRFADLRAYAAHLVNTKGEGIDA